MAVYLFGYAWHNELDVSALRDGDHFDSLVFDLYGPQILVWMKEFREQDRCGSCFNDSGKTWKAR